MTEYYVIKKNVSGEYLLSDKNFILMKSPNGNQCWVKFTDEIKNKTSSSDKFVICSKVTDKKYIQILCER